MMVDLVPGSAVPPPSEVRLERIQDALEQRFPPAYLQFLKEANGAKLVDKTLKAGSREVVIERFLPVLDDFKNDQKNGWAEVEVVASQLDTRLVTDEDMTGVDLVPIASLFAGDFLVLDYRDGKAQPSVGLWDHERSQDFAPNVTPVADSFEAFRALID